MSHVNPKPYFHVSYSLNSLKQGYIGDYIGDYYRVYQGDTRSLDNGSCDFPMGPFCELLPISGLPRSIKVMCGQCYQRGHEGYVGACRSVGETRGT